jgi:RimJ/RimL family protein N-acetyltransferase
LHLEPLTAAYERIAREYLDRAPYDNVFLIDLIATEPALRTRGRLYVALEDSAVRGVAFFGRQTVIAAERDAIPAFAEVAPRFPSVRMIVGPREQIAAFWKASAQHFPAPRFVRERQLVMVLTPQALRVPDAPDVSVRHARVDEWREVSENSAKMITGELGYDPRTTAGDFGIGVRQMIERGVWWVGECADDVDAKPRLCFFCHVGSQSDRTAQLQGIWTPVDLRGCGLATAAFAKICAHLLASSPTLSLYVNDFNEEAIRMYERAGFTTISEFQTILL